MAGLVQNPNAGKITDPTLQKVIAAIRAKVPPALDVPYNQVITAGMKVMLSPATSHLLTDRLAAPGPLYQKVAQIVTQLIALLYKESNRKMSLPAAVLASTELMCVALDVAERAQSITLSPDVIAACTHATSMAVLKMFGIGDQQVQRAVAAGHAAQQQPVTPAKG